MPWASSISTLPDDHVERSSLVSEVRERVRPRFVVQLSKFLIHVKSSLWFVPVLCVLAGVLLSLGTIALDRYFDYAVPEELDADAQPGVRVRVRFGAGRHRVREGRNHARRSNRRVTGSSPVGGAATSGNAPRSC